MRVTIAYRSDETNLNAPPPPRAASTSLAGLLELLLPRICAGCHIPLAGRAHPSREINSVLCASCSSALVFLESEGCRLCQLPTPTADGTEYCPRCSVEGSPLDTCTARVAFVGSTEEWVRGFKYPRAGISGLVPAPESVVVALARDAADMMDRPTPDLIVPVPLHRRRLRERGFNPAATLAREISKKLKCRLATSLLVRERDTPTQTHLGRRQRRSNVRDAFRCSTKSAATIWLVDDVVTTGSTLEEAARCLRRAGAKNVHGVCVARTG